MIIAFMGNDGSGKTTLATYVYNKFLKIGLPADYQPEFQYFLIKYVMRFLGRKTENIRMAFLSRKNRRNKSLTFKLWPYIVWFDFLLFWVYLKIFKRKKMVIFDRYVYDFLISWEYLEYENDFLRKLYLIFPMPDLSFVCIVSPEIAYMRKTRYNLDFYKVQTRRYLELARNLCIQTIDTSKPLKETISKVTNAIIGMYSLSKIEKTEEFFSKRAIKHKEIPMYLFEKLWKLMLTYRKGDNFFILDAGCGAGAWSRRFKEKNCEVIGLDFSEGMIKLAKNLNKCCYCKSDLFNLPFYDNVFDIVFFGYVLHHFTINEIGKILKEAYRVVKRGGIVVSVEPNLLNPYNFLRIHPKSPLRDNVNHIPQERPLAFNDFEKCHKIFDRIYFHTISFVPSRRMDTYEKALKKFFANLDAKLEKIPVTRIFASNIVTIGKKVYEF